MCRGSHVPTTLRPWPFHRGVKQCENVTDTLINNPNANEGKSNIQPENVPSNYKVKDPLPTTIDEIVAKKVRKFGNKCGKLRRVNWITRRFIPLLMWGIFGSLFWFNRLHILNHRIKKAVSVNKLSNREEEVQPEDSNTIWQAFLSAKLVLWSCLHWLVGVASNQPPQGPLISMM